MNVSLILKASMVSVAVILTTCLCYKVVKQAVIENNELMVHELAQSMLPQLMAERDKSANLLKSLQSIPSIQRAELTSSSGLPLALYVRQGIAYEPNQDSLESSLLNNSLDSFGLHVVAPLTFDTQIIANLHVILDLWPSYVNIIMWLILIFSAPIIIFTLTKRLKIYVRIERSNKDFRRKC